MNDTNIDGKREQGADGRRHFNINIGLLAGLFGGAVLGSLIGAVAHDIPLYTGFGMLLGMAISFDMMTHLKRKEEKSRQNDEMRE